MLVVRFPSQNSPVSSFLSLLKTNFFSSTNVTVHFTLCFSTSQYWKNESASLESRLENLMVDDDWCLSVCVCARTQVCSKASVPTGLLLLLLLIMMMMKVIWLFSHRHLLQKHCWAANSMKHRSSLLLQAANRLARWNPCLIALCRRLCSKGAHNLFSCTLNSILLATTLFTSASFFYFFFSSTYYFAWPLLILNWSRWTSGMNGKYYVEAGRCRNDCVSSSFSSSFSSFALWCQLTGWWWWCWQWWWLLMVVVVVLASTWFCLDWTRQIVAN